MSDLAAQPRRNAAVLRFVIGGIVTIGVIALAAGERFFMPTTFSVHAPNLAALAVASLPVKLHLAAAAVAFGIGVVLLIGVKGTTLHRALGWSWVIAMGTTAVSSLFIRVVNNGAFSLIHLLSGWVIIALPMAVWAARRHKVDFHRKMMTGLFTGGLLIAGALTLLPGRLMWTLFFG